MGYFSRLDQDLMALNKKFKTELDSRPANAKEREARTEQKKLYKEFQSRTQELIAVQDYEGLEALIKQVQKRAQFLSGEL